MDAQAVPAVALDRAAAVHPTTQTSRCNQSGTLAAELGGHTERGAVPAGRHRRDEPAGPMDQAAEAHRLLAAGGVIGKLVLVNPNYAG